MKTRISFALAFVLLLTAGSCNKIKDALTVKVDTEISVNLPITVGEPVLKTTLYPFSATETLDPEENETVQLYRERIRGYELTGVQGTVSGLNTEFILSGAVLSVTTPTQSAAWSIDNLNVTNGTVLTFDNADGQWTTINEMLDSGEILTITFSGNSDKPAVVYTLILLFKLTVTAGILG